MDIERFGSILAGHGVRHGSGVPCSYFTALVNYMEADANLDYLPAASEGEAVAIAAGLVTAGKPAFALMQNSGLGNAVNPITSMLTIYQMPVLLLISHRGEPGGKPDEPQHELMGRITSELAKLCGLEVSILDEGTFDQTIAGALERGVPAAWICREGTIEGGPKAPRVDLVIETGKVAVPSRRTFRPVMTREAALGATLPFLNAGADPPAVISTTGKLSRELFELDDRDHSRSNRFYMVGSMGCASGFGLGVARGAPDRSVLVLDGDGAILMKLGTLATIGHQAPRRLHHVVFDNGVHDTTGGQVTASPSIDLALCALASGYRRADTVSDPGEYVRLLAEHLASEGPTFLRLVIEPGARTDLGRPTITPREVYVRFRRFLGAPV